MSGKWRWEEYFIKKEEREEYMKILRSKIWTGICFLFMGFFLFEFCSTRLHAADSSYPNRPITIVVPFAPGGVTDLGARALAEAMEKRLKQPVVVVNKPGGATTIAGLAVATAKPDGYTLGFFPGSATLPEEYSYFYEAPYSSNDLRPICNVMSSVLTIAVKGDAPWNSLKEFIEFARNNPRMKYGHTGKSTVQYVVMVTIGKAEKLNLVDVPFDGDSAIVPALLGGHIPIGFIAFPVVKPLYEAKKVKVLAICIEKRASYAPEIPTVSELGYKLAYVPFVALYGPKGTPDDVVKKISELVHKISEDDDFLNRVKTLALQLSYEDTASFENYLLRYRRNLRAFFKDEGLVKK